MASAVRDIWIRIHGSEDVKFGKAAKEVDALKREAFSANEQFKILLASLKQVDKQRIAFEYDHSAAEAALSDLESLESRLKALQSKSFIPGGVRDEAKLQLAGISERRQALEAFVKESQRLRKEESDAELRILTLTAQKQDILEKRKVDQVGKAEKAKLKVIEDALTQEDELRAQREKDAKSFGAGDGVSPGFVRAIRDTERDVRRVDNAMQSAERATSAWGSKLDSATKILTRLSPLLRGATILIGTSMVSALAALGASLVTAAIALGGFITAFVGTLGPAAAVVAAVFARIAAVMQVVQARTQLMKAAFAQTNKQMIDQGAIAEKLRDSHNSLIHAQEAAADAERNLTLARRDAKDQLRDARRTAADADQRAADAATNLAEETTKAYRDIADAVEKASDAQRDYQHAQLGLERSRLGIEQAKLALQKFREEAGLAGSKFNEVFKKMQDVDLRRDPGALQKVVDSLGKEGKLSTDDQLKLKGLVLDLKDAKLGEKDATDALDDSQKNVNTTQAEANRLTRKGIGGVQGYRDAVREVADAKRAQKDATRDLNRLEKDGIDNNPSVISAAHARRDALDREKEATHDYKKELKGVGRIADSLNGPLSNYLQQLLNLSPAEAEFAGKVADLVTGFGKLVRNGTDPVIAALGRFIDGLGKAAPFISPLIEQIGTALAGAVDDFRKTLSKPLVFAGLLRLAQQTPKVIDRLSGIFDNLVQVFVGVANVFAGPLIERLGKLRDVTSGWVKSLSGVDSGNRSMKVLFKTFDAVADLIYEAVAAFLEFAVIVADAGDEFVTWLAEGAKHLKEFFKSKDGQRQLQKFFRETIPFAKALIRFIGKLVVIVLKLFQLFAPTFTDLLNGATSVLGVFEDLLDALNGLPTIVKRIGGLFLGGIWAKAGSTIGAVATGLAAFGATIDDLVVGLFDLGEKIIKGLVAGLRDNWSDVIGWIDRAAKNFIKFVKGIFGIKSPSSVFASIGKDIIRGLVQGIRSLASSLLGVGRWVWQQLKKGVGAAATTAASIGKSIVGGIVSGFKLGADLVSNLANWLFRKLKEGVKGILGFGGKVWNIGASILHGLAKGFTDVSSKLVNAVGSVIQDVIDVVTTLLDINSPSRVFADIGRNTMAGFFEGIADGNVVSFMEKHFGKDVWLAVARSMKGGGSLFDLLPFGVPKAIKNLFEGPGMVWNKGLPKDGIKSIPHFGKKRIVEVGGGSVGKNVTTGLLKLAAGIDKALRRTLRNLLLKKFANIRGLASGGIVNSHILSQLGERGKEAVLPLTTNVLAELGRQIVAAMTVRSPSAALAAQGAAGAGGVGSTMQPPVWHVENINMRTAEGGTPDGRTSAVLLARELERRGGFR